VDRQEDAGVRITGYRIEARVGRGGMGEVYRAEQLNLGRKVALKVLSPELAADDGFRRRFLRESRIAAAIDHPNVIPVYEAGEDGGLLYIAMRYVDGADLASLLEREGRLEPGRAMAIMAQVAGALDAAHARGLVHRDVKPANILLTAAAPGSAEHCYLCDFGLIKEMDAELALTATDQFVGTVPYVAPEQIEGRALDGRTDVYSLGCVIFQCLSGSVPFEGRTDVEVVFAHLRDPPPPLSTRVPGLAPALDKILARAMAKAKDDRFLTCSALVDAVAGQLGAGAGSHAPLLDDETRSMVRLPAPVGPDEWGFARPVGVRKPDPPDLGPPVGERSPPRGEPAPGRPQSRAHLRPAPPAHPRAGPAVRPPATPPADPWADPLADRRGGGRSRGRRGWTVLAVLLVPALASVAAMQVFARARSDGVEAPATAYTVAPRPTSPPKPACAGGWVEPEPGTPSRQAPLDAIRARLGVDGRFAGVVMRLFTGPDGVRRWYVKAYQETDPSIRGRWLVAEQPAGERRVVAEAAYDTRGYRSSDWDPVGGGDRGLAATTACLAGT
jgi:serine/threonine protein kinase